MAEIEGVKVRFKTDTGAWATVGTVSNDGLIRFSFDPVAVSADEETLLPEPTEEQKQIIDVVASLTNLLMKDMQGRGSGQTTLRRMIAQKIIHDDTEREY